MSSVLIEEFLFGWGISTTNTNTQSASFAFTTTNVSAAIVGTRAFLLPASRPRTLMGVGT